MTRPSRWPLAVESNSDMHPFIGYLPASIPRIRFQRPSGSVGMDEGEIDSITGHANHPHIRAQLLPTYAA